MIPCSIASPAAKKAAFFGQIATACSACPGMPVEKNWQISSWPLSQSKVACRVSSKGPRSLPQRLSHVALSVARSSAMTMQSGSRRRMYGSK